MILPKYVECGNSEIAAWFNLTISQGQTQFGLYCVLSHGVKEGNEWIFTQFGAGDVERLAEAALHDVALVVEEGGEAVQQTRH